MDDLPAVLLVDLMPRFGFRWTQHFGSPKILTRDARDAAVFRALVDIAGHDGKVYRRGALPVFEAVFNRMSDVFRDANLGIQKDEEMLQWLLRVRTDGGIALASAVDDQTWVELVYRIVVAHNRYHRVIPSLMKDGDRPNLSGFALAVDRFTEATKIEWDQNIGYIFFYPRPELSSDVPRWEGNAQDSKPPADETPQPLTEQEIKEARWRYEIEHALDDEAKPEKDSDDSDSDPDGLEEGDEPDGDEQILDLLRYLDNMQTTRAAAAAAAAAQANQATTTDDAMDLNSE